MREFKTILFLSIALAMLVYAVPKLETGGGWTAPSLFAAGWIGFALLIIAALLHDLLGVDEETRDRLRTIKQWKRRRTERFLLERFGQTREKKAGPS